MKIHESDWRYIVDALLFVCLVGMAFIGVLLGLVIPEGPVSIGGSKYFLGLHRHQWGDIHAYLSIAFVVLMGLHLIFNWKWITAKSRNIFKHGAKPALIGIGALPLAVLFLFWLWTPKDAETFRAYGIGTQQGEGTIRGQLREALPSVEDPSGRDMVPAQARTLEKAPRPTEAPVREEDISGAAGEVTPPVSAEASREEEHHAQVGSITITGQYTFRDIERATGLSARTIVRELGLPEGVPVNETLGRLRRMYGFEIQDVRDVVARLLK